MTDQFIADIFEQYSAETEEEMDFETFYEELMELAESPIVLNSATKEQLEKLPFLSDIQIESILSYRYSFGSFNSLFELQLIDGLDMTEKMLVACRQDADHAQVRGLEPGAQVLGNVVPLLGNVVRHDDVLDT